MCRGQRCLISWGVAKGLGQIRYFARVESDGDIVNGRRIVAGSCTIAHVIKTRPAVLTVDLRLPKHALPKRAIIRYYYIPSSRFWMQFVIAIALWDCAAIAQGTVYLYNVTHPKTRLETGDVDEVDIVGAEPNAEVTVSLNGVTSDTGMMTDNTGFWSTQSTQGPTSATWPDCDFYTERWYVNGVEVSPYNVYDSYVEWNPILPFFWVCPNYPGTNCSGLIIIMSACGTGY